jgi:hypothetical protein
MDIPVPLPVFMALYEHRETSGARQEIREMAGEAIRERLAAQEQRASAAHQPAAMLGYQWKSLFLPAGTVLRAVLNGENTHTIVEGNHVVFDSKQVSPSAFVNTGGRAVRNA